MPYGGDPISVPSDAVRTLVGDLSTSSTGEFLTDAEYAYFLSVSPNNYLAAQLAANSLAAKFTGAAASVDGSGYIEKSVGDLKIKKSDAVQAAREFRSLGAELGRKAAAGVTPYAGGISISDKSSVESNTDRVRPAFVAKLFDNQGASDFATNTGTST